jgi:hypothetical protein
MPSLWQRPAHKPEENWTPLSDVMSAGTPKRATHPPMRASTQSSVEVAHRGMASGHLVDLSTTVNR